jgi:hypothetical protein
MENDRLAEIRSLGADTSVQINFGQGAPGAEALDGCSDMLLKASTDLLVSRS